MAVILGHELGARGGVWSHSTPRWADRPEGDMVQSRQALLTPRGWRGHDLGLPSLTVSRGRLVAPSMGSECRPGQWAMPEERRPWLMPPTPVRTCAPSLQARQRHTPALQAAQSAASL